MSIKTNIRQGNIAVAIIGLLLFALYCAGIFLFVEFFTSTAYISFGFTVVAFVLTFIMPRIAISRPDIEAVFFGIPMMGFATYFFFAQIFVGVVLIFFQSAVSWKTALFIQLALLVAFLVISVVSFAVQRASERQSEERKEQVASWNMQTVDVQSLIDLCKIAGADAATMQSLNHLADTVRYSDPFSGNHPAIQEVESRISGKMFDLRSACTSANYEVAHTLIQEIENLYAERSRKLLMIK